MRFFHYSTMGPHSSTCRSCLVLLLGVAAAVALGEPTPALAYSEQLSREESLTQQGLSQGDECDLHEESCAVSALQRQAHRVLKEAKRGQESAQDEGVRQPAVAAGYAQCGGEGWTGPAACEAGYVCKETNQWYSQCVPAAEGGAKSDLGANEDEDKDDDGEGDDDEDEEEDDGDNDFDDDEGEEDGEGEDADKGDDEPEAGSPREDEDGGDEEEPQQVPLPPNPPTPEPPVVAGPLHPIIIKGNFLYDSVTGARFFAKGVAYNPRNTHYDIRWGKSPNCTPGEPPHGELSYSADVMSDDLEYMWGPALKAIANSGANTVRIYNIDPENSHAKFMEAAAALGLYVIIPLTRKDWGFLPAFPSPDCYTKTIEGYGHVGVNLLTTGKLIVKEFSKYSNTLLFTIANEMTVNDKNGFAAFPCVKAYARDIHQYQASCATNMRRVPLIYADMDIGDDRTMVGEYMGCEVEGPDDAVDAYGINVYSWCDPDYFDEGGKPNFNYSPYYTIKKGFESFDKPVLFTEFGCNVGAFHTSCPYQGGRTWPDVKVITDVMGEILSGAIAFEFSMEVNEYGLALTPGFVSGQKDLYLLDNYYALKEQFEKHDISSSWDSANAAEDMVDCQWQPDSVAVMSVKHAKRACPPAEDATRLQRQRGTDVVVSWAKLPPTPDAPLANVGNQSECPAYTVPAVAYQEGCCHMTCQS